MTKHHQILIPGIGVLCYLNEQLHREDGPAVEYNNGDKHWYINNKRHREDGPAIVFQDGSEEWYLNDYRHREDGPAIICPDGTLFWYLNGIEVKPEDLPCDYEYIKLKYLS